MDITVYLPDAIGDRAKGAGLNLSRLLRDAVLDELERRDTVATTLTNTSTHLIALEDENGRAYTGRITGVRIAEDRDVEVYLTDDERVIVYQSDRQQFLPIPDPEEELRHWLTDDAEYAAALAALGAKPIIDL